MIPYLRLEIEDHSLAYELLAWAGVSLAYLSGAVLERRSRAGLDGTAARPAPPP